MNQLIFSGPAHLQMQGKEVLQFLDVNEIHAEYGLIGFQDHLVRVVDYRLRGLLAIQRVIETGNDSQFPTGFNFPSHVSILKLPTGDLVIELRDTDNQNPLHMLWIAIGFSDTIPNYEYVYQDKEYLSEDGSIALLSLYKRPHIHTAKHQPIYYSFSNR